MELHRYKELKEKVDSQGQPAARLQRLGKNTYQVIAPRFDSSTGDELEPEIIPVNKSGVDQSIEQIEQQIANLQKSLAGLKELQADAAALEPAANPQ